MAQNLIRWGLIFATFLGMPAQGRAAASLPESWMIEARSAEHSNETKKAYDLYVKLFEYKEFQDESILGVVRCLLHDNEYALAKAQLSSFIQTRNPFNPDIRLEYVGVLTKLGEYEPALKELDVVEELRPGYGPAKEKRAGVYLKLKKFEAAIAEYNEVVKNNPSAFDAFVGRGWAYYEKNESAKAISDARHAVEMRPMSTEAKMLLGMAMYQSGDFRSSEDAFKTVLKSSPNSIPANEKLGDIYVKTNRHHNAVEAYKQCIAQEPARLDIGMKLGNVYLTLKDHLHAEEEFKRQLSILPSHEPAAYALVKLHLEDKRADLAAKVLADYTEKFPRKVWATVAYLKLLVSIKKLDWAEDFVQKAMLAQNFSPESYLLYGYIKDMKSESHEALKILVDAEKANPNDAKIKFNQALVLEKVGRTEEAIEKYKEIKTDTNIAYKAKVNMAYLLNTRGNKSAAETALKDAGEEVQARNLASAESTNAAPSTDILQKGETLQMFSMRIYGTTKRWKKIYEINKDVISDSRNVAPGTVLKLIPDEKTLENRTARGETYNSMEPGQDGSVAKQDVVALSAAKPFRDMELP